MLGGPASPPVEMKPCAGISDRVGDQLRARLNAVRHFAVTCQNWFPTMTKLARWSQRFNNSWLRNTLMITGSRYPDHRTSCAPAH